MTQSFTGRAGLVTGAASGIGRATAKMLAARGAAVTLSDKDRDGGNAAVEEILRSGGQARFAPCDVKDPDAIRQMVDEAAAAYGRLDFAFNNAAITAMPTKTIGTSIEDWRAQIETDLSSVFYCMKYELPHMVAARRGAIVNNSSDAGLKVVPGIPGYVAAKHGVIALSRTAAVEYGGFGVRVNAVCPGATHTPMMALWTKGDAEIERQFCANIPLSRFAEPDEVAEAVLWLFSDAASYVTGIALPVDGGVTAA
jgi:NAD(P)-dependent dehydrogenase (short-subunit alcohol dehydrogenase family)